MTKTTSPECLETLLCFGASDGDLRQCELRTKAPNAKCRKAEIQQKYSPNAPNAKWMNHEGGALH